MADKSQAFLLDRFDDVGSTVRNRKSGRILSADIDYPTIRVGPAGTPKMLLHRILWIMRHGDIPAGLLVDHVDGNPRNRLPGNLRTVTRSQNQYNRAPTAGRKLHFGVYPYGSKDRWYVKIERAKATFQGGIFTDYSQACDRADALRAELHGEFRRMEVCHR